MSLLKIVAISDTHEQEHKIQLPDGDLLIHAGDWTNKGGQGAMEKFLKWFSSQPHEFKIVICGNHEVATDIGPLREHKIALINSFMGEKTFYLENSSVSINGYNIYGSPISPAFYSWAWNRTRGEDIAAEWTKIPDDTNILITHGPSYGVLDLIEDNWNNQGRDLHQGCEDLAKRIKQLKDLKLHIAGHLHSPSNHKLIEIDGVKFTNAAICDERYQPIQKPIVIDLE